LGLDTSSSKFDRRETASGRTNDIIARRFSPDWNEASTPLTDDFAPVEYLKAVERHNEKQG